jgi:hypothetical protein
MAVAQRPRPAHEAASTAQAELSHGLVPGGPMAAGDHDLRSFLDEQLRGGEADAAACAGDDCDLAVKFPISGLPSGYP